MYKKSLFETKCLPLLAPKFINPPHITDEKSFNHNKTPEIMSARDWKKMLVAVQEGDLELLRHYIQTGINPNYQHPELLTTPLIESITFQHVELVEYLLENGADPTLKAGFSNDSPILVAKQTKNKRIIQLIKKALPRKHSFLHQWKDKLWSK